MKVRIESYDENWNILFSKIRDELHGLLEDFDPKIEHFGSTSVPGLAAKPVIDILVGIVDIDMFDLLVNKVLGNKKYIFYEAFNDLMPERRLFVRLKDEVNGEEFEQIYEVLEDIPHDKINDARIAHIHVWEYNSEDWIRHIAFREYLKSHDNIRIEYENLKKNLSQQNWKHGMAYNIGKDEFLKAEERKAVLWYRGVK